MKKVDDKKRGNIMTIDVERWAVLGGESELFGMALYENCFVGEMSNGTTVLTYGNGGENALECLVFKGGKVIDFRTFGYPEMDTPQIIEIIEYVQEKRKN